MDAAATGSEILSNTSSTEISRSLSISDIAKVFEKGGKLSCNTLNCIASSAPTTSGRVDNIWPNLIYAGPNAVSALTIGGNCISPFKPNSLNGFPVMRMISLSTGGKSSLSKITCIAPVRSNVAPVRIRRHMLCGPRI